VEGVIPLPCAMELLKVLPLERWAIVTSCTRALANVRIRRSRIAVASAFGHLHRCEPWQA